MQYYITLAEKGSVLFYDKSSDSFVKTNDEATPFESDTEAMKVAQYLPRYSNIIKVPS